MRPVWWLGIVLAAGLVAGIFAMLASPLPDGLDTTIGRLGLPEGESGREAPLPDYSVPGVRNAKAGTFIASAAGLVLVLLITVLVGKLLARRRPAASAGNLPGAPEDPTSSGGEQP